MKAKSVTGSSASEIKAAVEDCITKHFQPTLAIIFMSVKQDREAISNILKDVGVDVVGATSSGEFVDGHQSAGEIAVLLLDIDRSHYRILSQEIGELSLSDAVGKVTRKARSHFERPAFILCSTLLTGDGRMLDGEFLIQSFIDKLGPQVTLFGGMAGDDITFTGTYVFTHNWSTDYGMIALVLNEDTVSLQGLAISGWKPVGVAKKVTKSEENLLYTIDDKPALEMYLRYLGSDIGSTDDQIRFFESVGNHFPLQIDREGREPKMCSPIGYDREKGALICESNVPQGATFRFSTPPDFDILETVLQEAREIRTVHEDAEALLIFSCAGRLAALGPMAKQENEGLHKIWNAPMAGFYTYGEFGKGRNGKHEFHSTTCSWVALSEKTVNES
jgi:hypothetical protein